MINWNSFIRSVIAYSKYSDRVHINKKAFLFHKKTFTVTNKQQQKFFKGDIKALFISTSRYISLRINYRLILHFLRFFLGRLSFTLHNVDGTKHWIELNWIKPGVSRPSIEGWDKFSTNTGSAFLFFYFLTHSLFRFLVHFVAYWWVTTVNTKQRLRNKLLINFGGARYKYKVN